MPSSSLLLEKDLGPRAALGCIQRFVDRVLRLVVMSHRDTDSSTHSNNSTGPLSTPPGLDDASLQANPYLPSLRDFVLAQLFCAAADGAMQTVQEVALLCGWTPEDDDDDDDDDNLGRGKGSRSLSALSYSWSATMSRPIPTWLTGYSEEALQSIFPQNGTSSSAVAATSSDLASFANEPFQLLHYCAISPRPEVLEFVLLHKHLFESALELRVETSAGSKAMTTANRVDILPGITPLHLACITGTVSGVRALLAFGANVRAKREGGRSPLDDAALTAVEAQLEVLPQLPTKTRLSVCLSPSSTASTHLSPPTGTPLSRAVATPVPLQTSSAGAKSASPKKSDPHFVISMLLVARGGESTFVSRVAGEHLTREESKNSKKRQQQQQQKGPTPFKSEQSFGESALASLNWSSSSMVIQRAEEKKLLMLARMKTYMDIVVQEVHYRVANRQRIDDVTEAVEQQGADDGNMAMAVEPLSKKQAAISRRRRAEIEREGHPSFQTALSLCIRQRLLLQHRARQDAIANTPGIIADSPSSGSAHPGPLLAGLKVGDFVVVAASSRYLNSRSLSAAAVSRIVEARSQDEILKKANMLGFSVMEARQGGVGDGFLAMSPVKSQRTGWAAAIGSDFHHQGGAASGASPLSLSAQSGLLRLPPTTTTGPGSASVSHGIFSPAQIQHRHQQHLTVGAAEEPLYHHHHHHSQQEGEEEESSAVQDTTLMIPQAELHSRRNQQQQQQPKIVIDRRRVVEPIHFIELSENCSSQSGAAIFSAEILAGRASSIVGEVMFVGELPAGLARPVAGGGGESNDGLEVGEESALCALFVGLRVDPRHANCDGTYCFDGIRHFEGRADDGMGGSVLCGLYVPAADVTLVNSPVGRRVAAHRLVRAISQARSAKALEIRLERKLAPMNGGLRQEAGLGHGEHGVPHLPAGLTVIKSKGRNSGAAIETVTIVIGNGGDGAQTPMPTSNFLLHGEEDDGGDKRQQQYQQQQRSQTSMSHEQEMKRIFKRKKRLEVAEVTRLRKQL